jgi:hypothetical protein
MSAAMAWVVELEAKSGWGEVGTIDVGRSKRRVVGLTAEEVGLTLAEGNGLLIELPRLVRDCLEIGVCRQIIRHGWRQRQ